MIKTEQYPLFIPPKTYSSKRYRDWNQKEANGYLKWFCTNKASRIQYLLDYLSIESTGNSEIDIMAIGDAVTTALGYSMFSIFKNGSYALTNEGYAIVTDLAIYISEELIKNNVKLKWNRVSKPNSDISYNLPCIFGFSKVNHVDLIRAGTTNSLSILAKDENSSIWLSLYKACLEKQ